MAFIEIPEELVDAAYNQLIEEGLNSDANQDWLVDVVTDLMWSNGLDPVDENQDYAMKIEDELRGKLINLVILRFLKLGQEGVEFERR